MDVIPTWVFTAITITLLLVTAYVAIRTEGGVKQPIKLLVLTVVTVVYVFSLTFIQGVSPQLGLDLKGGVSVILEAKGNPSSEELDIAVDVIRSRVDGLGVAEPEISRQGNNIVVDLPGVKDARKAQELIGQTAELRFREVAENASTDPQIQQVLAQVTANSQASASSSKTTTTTKKKSTTTTSTASTTSTTQAGGAGKSFRQATTPTVPITAEPQQTSQAIPTTTSATNSITLQCGGTSPKQVVLTGDLTQPTAREDDKADKPIIALDKKTGQAYALCPAVLKGDIVKNASRQVDQLGEISVGVELTGDGGKQFTQNIGIPLSGQQVAIVLDSLVISAPTIQPDLANGLTDNKLQITVGNSKDQTEQVDSLVTVLRYGKLPVVLVQQTAQKISPTLGTDQLHAGLIAGAVGLLLVLIYMLLYYRVLALVVLAGLGLTGMSVYAIICWAGVNFGMSLTLAGAVGLIVSLGVTVDSYVVYFEKLKDEVRQGRSVRSCLDPAFKASFRTILAADLVSLIGAFTLFMLASGSVKGFALFLGLSVFLDLIFSLCFMHPMVKLLAQNKSLIKNSKFGFAAALDKKDLTA